MLCAGCDVGSLTAKAVILDDGQILGSEIITVLPSAAQSATTVMQRLSRRLHLDFKEIGPICATGYGRHGIPFAGLHKSEIACHALGAFHTERTVRTIIDIGGQDCKVIAIDHAGRVTDFIMNDKCAAGTGRSLEMLAHTLGLTLEELGELAARSRRPIEISNKCSIFMELEVLEAIYCRKPQRHIACGVADAVARRVAALSRAVKIVPPVCITGGVSKNKGVVKRLEKQLHQRFKPLERDPQIMGALGAALFAAGSDMGARS